MLVCSVPIGVIHGRHSSLTLLFTPHRGPYCVTFATKCNVLTINVPIGKQNYVPHRVSKNNPAVVVPEVPAVHVVTARSVLSGTEHITDGHEDVPIKNINVNITNLYDDGTTIISQIQDQTITRKWKDSFNVTYLFTIDSCIFPNFDKIAFVDTPKRSLSIRNAGGSSEISEALSMQYMYYRFHTSQFVPEMEVDYWIESKICDYLMRCNGENFGVSVTRAVSYPFTQEFSYDNAITLLNKKLYGLIVARNSISDKHMFHRSILHIWCMSAQTAHNIKKAHEEIVRQDINRTYDNVYVICTVCPHVYIYNNRLQNK